jgi:hypothetical protein
VDRRDTVPITQKHWMNAILRVNANQVRILHTIIPLSLQNIPVFPNFAIQQNIVRRILEIAFRGGGVFSGQFSGYQA